jgi:hypothetical protein
MGRSADKQSEKEPRSKKRESDVVTFVFDYRSTPRTQLRMAKKKPAKKKPAKKKAVRKDYVQTAFDAARKSIS